MEMRGEGQREEGWLSLLCLLTIACVLYLCLCAISSLSLFTDVLHKSCILPFCFWCCQLLQNDGNGAKIKVSSWKADFMNTLAFCRMLTACVWQQETKGWVVCVCVCVRLSFLKPVCVHQHSWFAGLSYFDPGHEAWLRMLTFYLYCVLEYMHLNFIVFHSYLYSFEFLVKLR